MDKAAELSRTPEPKRGAGDAIQRRYGQGKAPQPSRAVAAWKRTRAANAQWRQQCQKRSQKVSAAQRALGIAEGMIPASQEERVIARVVGEAIGKRLAKAGRSNSERPGGEMFHGVGPPTLPKELAPQQRSWPFGEAKSEQSYANSLAAPHYRQRWEKEKIGERMREVAEQARTSWRGKLSLDREKYVEAAVRREVGPKAQQLDREMREDMEEHRPQWEVLASMPCGARRNAPSASARRRSPGSRRGRALTS